MYAIIEDSGRQFKVAEGERIQVDLREAKAGDVVEFDKVLFVNDGPSARVGTPYLSGAKVVGTVESETKGKKVISYKYQRREPYHRKVGHRQRTLRVKITQIAVS